MLIEVRPVIPATWGTEAGGSQGQGLPRLEGELIQVVQPTETLSQK